MKLHIFLNKGVKLSLLTTTLLIFTLGSCKKDNYIIGGTITNVNQYKNETTYEYLLSNPIFDTLVQLIDAAGLENEIDAQGNTFFAVTNSCIFNYLNAKTETLQATVNQNARFDLDSLKYYLKNNINGTADSLKMYLINEPLTYDSLTNIGAIYPTELPGDSVAISYEFTTSTLQGYSNIVSTVPQIVYFTQLWTYYAISDANPISAILSSQGTTQLVQTSGIYTQNGVVDVLNNSATLFFYGQKTN